MELQSYAARLASDARSAGLLLADTDPGQRTRAIEKIADLVEHHHEAVLRANAIDVARAEEAGLAPAMVARLRLDPTRVSKMARAVRDIAQQPDPIGAVLESRTRPDGLLIQRRRVPIGAVLFCYESRPNVTTDAASLCLRSGNAVILRGGKEAFECNRVLGSFIHDALVHASLPEASVRVVETTDRNLLTELLKLDQLLDLVIPRGGESLIRAVVEQSSIPVLKHFTGNCHIYIDRDMPDARQVIDICVNAKTSYPGGAVCNAVEHILIHRDRSSVIAPLCVALREKGVEVRGDDSARDVVPDLVPATDADWDAEYLALVVALRVVDSIDDAIDHINRHGSHHTDAILCTDPHSIERFVRRVDSASVMVNASTRLADGGEYGLGAEIGISTDKLHARGPMGAFDMTTYKWVVTGAGHLRA